MATSGKSLDPSRVATGTSVRSVDAIIKSDGAVRIETDQFKMTIYALEATEAGSTAKALRVVEALRGANPKAQGIGVGDPLDASVGSSTVC